MSEDEVVKINETTEALQEATTKMLQESLWRFELMHMISSFCWNHLQICSMHFSEVKVPCELWEKQ